MCICPILHSEHTDDANRAPGAFSVPHAGFAAGDFHGRAGEGQERDLRETVSLEIVIFFKYIV